PSDDHSLGLGSCLRRSAMLLYDRGELTAARDLLDQAVGHHTDALARRPDLLGAREDLGHCHALLGNVYSRMAKPDKSEAAHRKAIEIREELASSFPNTPHYQRLAATSWAALAEQLSSPQMFRIVEALAAHRKAVDYQQKVVAGPDALAIDHSVLGTALLGLA